MPATERCMMPIDRYWTSCLFGVFVDSSVLLNIIGCGALPVSSTTPLSHRVGRAPSLSCVFRILSVVYLGIALCDMP